MTVDVWALWPSRALDADETSASRVLRADVLVLVLLLLPLEKAVPPPVVREKLWLLPPSGLPGRMLKLLWPSEEAAGRPNWLSRLEKDDRASELFAAPIVLFWADDCTLFTSDSCQVFGTQSIFCINLRRHSRLCEVLKIEDKLANRQRIVSNKDKILRIMNNFFDHYSFIVTHV